LDKRCADLGIKQRLIPPKSPQTDIMVEGFTGYVKGVLQNHHSSSGEELEDRLHHYARLYNQQLP
jgi:transposase InsO family protein